MRLLHVGPAYAPFQGGAEAYLQQISQRFAALGHDVTVITTQAECAQDFWAGRPSGPIEHCRQDGVGVIRLPLSAWPPAPWAFHLLHRLAQQANLLPADPSLWLASLLPRVPGAAELLASLPEFDLVHAVNIAFPSLMVAAWHAARERGVPFIATPFVHVNGSRLYPLTSLRDADRVLVQSQTEQQAIVRYGVNPARTALMGVGIDPVDVCGGDAARFRAAHKIADGPVVTFIGTVSTDKGARSLYRAMQQFWQAGGRATLVVAGRMTPELAHVVQPDQRCRPLGVISAAVKRDLLAASSILAVPSRVESLGLAYLEAWANRVPVIGARIGSTAELIAHGVNGWLVPFGAVTELAEGIRLLLHDEPLRRRLGENGRREVAERFTWDRIFPRIESEYGRVPAKPFAHQ